MVSPILVWDASALAKRYTLEIGSDIVNALFRHTPGLAMITTLWGYAETYSILVRARNRGTVDASEFSDSISSLQWEVLGGTGMTVVEVEDDDILAGIPLIAEHNINSTDAAILACALRLVSVQSEDDPRLVLVAADRRLLRAAAAEGLATLNPETFTGIDVAGWLASF
jgi:predicted nucleic acid-binding protein